jgi:beta-xylosidase
MPPIFAENRKNLEPLLDVPLRDTAITQAPDGVWYLIGTPQDGDGGFQNNDGVRLWRSRDFKNWEDIGQVWSIEKDAGTPASAWQKEKRVNPDKPDGPLVRGMTSPEIHALRDTFWITYSMNGQGTGLLKSKSGKPEGPFEDLGRITRDGSDASLFQDDDGSVYWVVGEGWVAKMKPDLGGLAGPLRLLRPAPFPKLALHGSKFALEFTNSPRTLGLAGAHLFKAQGRYWLAAASVRDRMGVGCWDTFVCGADSLEGPFSDPMLMIPHGGQTTVFKGPGGGLHASFAGRDSRAVFRDKPASVPLVFNGEVLYGRKVAPFPRKAFDVVTEFGPWAALKPVSGFGIRDLQFSMAPDGYAYLTGSGVDNSYAGRIMLFRSKDLKTWEPVKVEFDYMSLPGATEADRAARFDDPKQKNSLGSKYMDSEIYFADGTFHIFTSLYDVKKPDGSPAVGGPMWLRSKSGKAEGTYEFVCRAFAQSSVFVDDDGKSYLFFNGRLSEWNPSGSSLEGSRIDLKTNIGTLFTKGDVATNLLKIDGKYVIFATGWCGGTYGENYRIDGTYDWVYWQSDTLKGPYEMPRRAYAMPHAGHSCPPVKGPDGRWYGLLFGNDSTGPWWQRAGVLVYDVGVDPDGTVRVVLKK